MSDLKRYIQERKRKDKNFAEGFEEGYEQFKRLPKNIKLIDCTPLEKNKKYQGKFLATVRRGGKIKVIAVGTNPEQVLNEAWEKGYKKPHLDRISASKSTAVVFYNADYQIALDRLRDKNDPVVSSQEFWKDFRRTA